MLPGSNGIAGHRLLFPALCSRSDPIRWRGFAGPPGVLGFLARFFCFACPTGLDAATASLSLVR